MPFQSEAQRRFLFANHPDIAKRWAREYPGQHNLPYHKRDMKKAIKRGTRLGRR